MDTEEVKNFFLFFIIFYCFLNYRMQKPSLYLASAVVNYTRSFVTLINFNYPSPIKKDKTESVFPPSIMLILIFNKPNKYISLAGSFTYTHYNSCFNISLKPKKEKTGDKNLLPHLVPQLK